MKLALLDYLVCIQCQSTLACDSTEEQNGEVIDGTLTCTGCGRTYLITDGIPRFVNHETPLEGKNIETADAFGWEWQKWSYLHSIEKYTDQFLDWIYPIEADFLKDKVVLDAGCGMGRFSLVSHTFGAKLVLAVDASEAVEAAYRNARDYPTVQVIQADIHHMPFRQQAEAQVDFGFSIGVLHHLDDPEAGFRALARHIQVGGSIFGWVYGRENNGWLIHIVNPIRELITSRLSRRVLYVLSWLITVILQPVLRVVYRPVSKIEALKGLRKILPYYEYLAWLSAFGFRHNHHVVFDHLVAPVAYYISKEEYKAWFDRAQIELIDLSWRNRNGWRGHGRITQATHHS